MAIFQNCFANSYLKLSANKINNLYSTIYLHINISRIYYINFKNKITFKNLHNKEIYTGNKMLKIINGNIRKFKLKLVTWNKATKNHHNNQNVLDSILTKYKPHILNLCEANLKTNIHSIHNSVINYKIEVTKQSDASNMSRSCLLIHNNVDYIRRFDLEDNDTSNIWIEIKNKRKNILIMGVYRQWKLTKNVNLPKSHNSSQQKVRLIKTLNKWQQALTENKNCIVMMDSNIDTQNSNHNKTWNVENLKTRLYDFINNNNITIHNNKIIHFSTIHQNSTIDHIFSNCPDKLTQVRTERQIHSDHALLHCNYTSNSQIVNPKFMFINF